MHYIIVMDNSRFLWFVNKTNSENQWARWKTDDQGHWI